MRVFNYVRAGNDYPKSAVNYGIINSGNEPEHNYHQANAIVTWNNYGTAKKIADKIVANGGIHLAMENGYMLREEGWYAVGLNGYAGLDKRNVNPAGTDRFNSLDLPISMWNNNERGHILVCAQRGGGYSPLAMNNDWPNWIIKQIRKYTRKPIVFRPHPARRRVPDILDNVIIEESLSLQDLLEDAYCLVTHSSNCGNEALLAGIPVVCTSEYASFAKQASRLGDGFASLYKAKNRRAYFNQLACRQFSLKEISQGDIWNVFLK